MSGYDWLLFPHLLSAFVFFSGAAAAGILQTAALTRERPSEIRSPAHGLEAGVIYESLTEPPFPAEAARIALLR